MSNRKEITKILTDAIECHVNPNSDTRIYTAKEVTFNQPFAQARTKPYDTDVPMVFNPSHTEDKSSDVPDYATGHSIRVDFMQFKPLNNSVSGIEKGDFYCYEIKSCVEDFHSKNGHNFIGDYNYYVMPENVYDKVCKEIPWGVGVFVAKIKDNKEVVLQQIKNAKRRNREKSVSEMLLMMFRSAARDVHKK